MNVIVTLSIGVVLKVTAVENSSGGVICLSTWCLIMGIRLSGRKKRRAGPLVETYTRVLTMRT